MDRVEIWFIAGVALVVGLVLFLKPVRIDYGACVVSHTVHHHEDAYVAPRLDFNGDLSLELVGARDWDENVCDAWQFPAGRAEAGG